VTSAADPNANIIFGAVIDEAMGDDVRVTVIATGFGGQRRRRRGSAEASAAVSSGSPEQQGDDALDVPSFLRSE
jgi:cell division protein FtsZ